MRPIPACLLLGCCALALLARSLELPLVLLDDGSVVFALADASYHARRALFSFQHFPAVLSVDPLLNYPAGARVPWPPLYDWLLALVARGFGDSRLAFERVAVWSSPLLGALSVPVVFYAGRLVSGVATGIVAAALFALLPISVLYAGVGDPDHHAFLALLGACYLAASLGRARPGEQGRWWTWEAALVLVRIAVLLSWSGSLLYLAVGELALLASAAVQRSPGRLLAQALGLLATALLVSPALLLAPPPLGGWLSGLSFSGLPVVFLLAGAAVAAELARHATRRTAVPPATLLARALALALLAGLVLLAFPEIRAGLAPAWAYLGRSGSFELNAEQMPLYESWRIGMERHTYPAAVLYGGFAYLIPVLWLPILLCARDAARRPRLLVLLVWVGGLGGLAVAQVRWGSDFAPAAAVGFAFSLTEMHRVLARLRWLGRGSLPVTVIAGLVLVAPTWAEFHQPRLGACLALWPAASVGRAARERPAVALDRFARRVRRATPFAEDPLDPRQPPSYGILAPPGLGHVLHYVAERATPVDNFGPQLDPARYREVERFYASRREDEAVAIARALGTRFVVTSSGSAGRERVVRRLHGREGAWSPGWSPLGHFRLVTEGPLQGRLPTGRSAVLLPYKLFEIVEGVVLEARAAPGQVLEASTTLHTPLRGVVSFRTRAEAGADGWVRLRVPYATGMQGDVRAEAYRITLGETSWELSIGEAQVVGGARVELRPSPIP